MGGLFGKPKVPAAQPVAPAATQVTDAAADSATQSAADKQKRKRGASTLQTGMRSIMSEALSASSAGKQKLGD